MKTKLQYFILLIIFIMSALSKTNKAAAKVIVKEKGKDPIGDEVNEILNTDETKDITKASKINTNVSLTEFERNTVLNKLSSFDKDSGECTRALTEKDIFGMTLHEKELDEGDIQHIKFLNVDGRFKNNSGFLLNVTIVVVEDKRFYLSIGNQEIRKATGKDLFINHLPHMLHILENLTPGFLSEEDIEEEASAIDSFGTIKE